MTAAEAPPAAPGAISPVAISLKGATKAFGAGGSAVVALEAIDLEVRRGEFVCVVGASGCGKSTLLNLVAGLDRATVGEITVAGRAGLMFQDAALFPWLTVRDNVALPLRLAGVGKAERRQRAEDFLAAVHLAGQGHRRPHQLSGGMRQRVALARALVQDVEILLMDEPFGALDAMTRDLLHDELERLWRSRAGLSVVFVTHNVREAVRLADRVILLTSRPRRIESPDVAALAAKVTARLRQEVSRHGRL